MTIQARKTNYFGLKTQKALWNLSPFSNSTKNMKYMKISFLAEWLVNNISYLSG